MTPFALFTVDAPPQGKGRHRLGYNPRTGRPQMFTPEATEVYEKQITWLAFTAMRGRKPTVLPVRLAMDVHIKPPKLSRPALAALLALPPTRKPDLDNVIKAVGDGCNAVVWVDDVQVADVIVRRHWSDHPRVDVWVWELGAPLWSAHDLAQLANGMAPSDGKPATAGGTGPAGDERPQAGVVGAAGPEKRLKTRLIASPPRLGKGPKP